MRTLFYDTYALFEIVKGSVSYSKYRSGIEVLTTRLNLMELYYTLLRIGFVAQAEEYYEKLLLVTVEIKDSEIKEAMRFKLQHKKKCLSYVDCVGYVVALKRNVPFLTGDKEFQGMENVEFVK